MTVLNTGSTEKFAAGWENIFTGGKGTKTAKKSVRGKPAATSARKSTQKKSNAKKKKK